MNTELIKILLTITLSFWEPFLNKIVFTVKQITKFAVSYPRSYSEISLLKILNNVNF